MKYIIIISSILLLMGCAKHMYAWHDHEGHKLYIRAMEDEYD